MKIAFFDTHEFESKIFNEFNLKSKHEIHYFSPRLNSTTAGLAKDFPCICAFANDKLDRETLKILNDGGTKLIALRSAGYNHVDIKAAHELNLKVVRVPEYSPYAIAEHVVAMLQTLNRKTHRAYNRVREGNFSLEGLVGFDLYGKTFGIIGVGKIGSKLAHIMTGFGCKVMLYDLHPDRNLEHKLGCTYTSLNEVLSQSDIISLHVPLTPRTRHLINSEALIKMKKGVILINTGRGALIDSKALVDALKSNHIGMAGLDVYEEEENYFFQDHSGEIMEDEILSRLLTFPNVLVTSHQGFLTTEALSNIAETTLNNIKDFEDGKKLANEVI